MARPTEEIRTRLQQNLLESRFEPFDSNADSNCLKQSYKETSGLELSDLNENEFVTYENFGTFRRYLIFADWLFI